MISAMIQNKNDIKEVKKREAKRTEFVSIVSHQLRTPLSIVRGYLEALLNQDQGPLTPDQKEYIAEALQKNNTMIQMVNDYLSAAQLDDQKIEMHVSATQIEDIVEEIVQSLSPFATASNCELHFEKPAQPLPSLMIDPIKIKQVIENVVANAIKYTGRGGRVTIRLSAHDDGVEFTCEDTGIGIPQQQQADIFTRFFRGHNVIGKDTQGSGLGLFIAKVMVDAAHGRIWFESQEGKGTTMHVFLPQKTE
ncbi:MAG: ATP-binding protein [Patescibacteria group bacterium]|jgi:signal transduction histidine kinase